MRTDIIYRYDGTFDGLLTCVFQSYLRHELPAALLTPDDGQTMLFETLFIETDHALAKRVVDGLTRKVSSEAVNFVRMAHLTCLNNRDAAILLFCRLAMSTGPSVMNALADARVNTLYRAINFLEREAHHYMGFVRFSDVSGALASIIRPKNSVLPLLDPHFSDRFNAERFIIYDATHRMALMHMPDVSRIVPMDDFKLPALRPEELEIAALWQRFHATIAIEGRVNPKLQRSLLPLRHRPLMTEFSKCAAEEDTLPPTVMPMPAIAHRAV